MTKTSKDTFKKLAHTQKSRTPKPLTKFSASESTTGGSSAQHAEFIAEPPKAAAKKKPRKSFEDESIQKKPGQKRQEPSLDDPIRAFYESLYEQQPHSQIARKYCLDHGLLDEDVAKKVLMDFKRLKY
jgi:hypothetical protein